MIWTNILCEGSCFYDIHTKKINKFTSIDNIGDKRIKWEKRKNPFYTNPTLRPSWCVKYNKKRIPQFHCIGLMGFKKCPFLGISDCRKKEYEYMQMGLSTLEHDLKKKHGETWDYDDVMPLTKKEIKLNNCIYKEMEKEHKKNEKK